jgi:DNA-binding helix-turn-helix protein
MMKDIDKKEVGRRIKQLRISKGYTLEAFGKLFGAGKSNVRTWENGISLPNKDRLYNISKIAGITVNELLYGNTEKDVEEIYQRLIKLPKEDILGIFRRVHNKFKFGGELEC